MFWKPNILQVVSINKHIILRVKVIKAGLLLLQTKQLPNQICLKQVINQGVDGQAKVMTPAAYHQAQQQATKTENHRHNQNQSISSRY